MNDLEKNIENANKKVEEKEAFLHRTNELKLNEARKDVALIETPIYIMVPHTKGDFPHYILQKETDKIVAILKLDENTKEKYEWSYREVMEKKE